MDGGDACASYSFEEPILSGIRHRSEPVLVDARRDSRDQDGREQDGPEQRGAFAGLGTELLLPLSTKGELRGVLSLGPKRSEEPYCRRDIRLLESVANQTALALEVSRLTSAVAAEAEQRVRFNNEIEIARQVQQRLFPKCAPAIAGLDLCGHCLPAETIGGDYYDFVLAPSGELGLAIGDVAGKGVPAALLMAGLQASLRSLTLAGISDLSELMAKLNVLVYDASPANRFATFFYGLYDPETRRLRYSTAGHNPALLLRASNGEVQWLKTRGVGLGLQRSSSYAQAELTLEPGDRLILYTDGVTEARNADGEEFGVDGLESTVRNGTDASASGVLNRVIAATTEFAGDAPQFDDITLIVARVL
jgi:sigma-B regulation protein RsbU (phosphoserine phosphatase)